MRKFNSINERLVFASENKTDLNIKILHLVIYIKKNI